MTDIDEDDMSILAFSLCNLHYSNHLGLTDFMQEVTDSLASIIKPGQTNTIQLGIDWIIENDLHVTALRYFGSLTYPPCKEIVIWLLYFPRHYIGDRYLEAFRKLEGTGSTKLSDNFRPTNPLTELPDLMEYKGEYYTLKEFKEVRQQEKNKKKPTKRPK